MPPSCYKMLSGAIILIVMIQEVPLIQGQPVTRSPLVAIISGTRIVNNDPTNNTYGRVEVQINGTWGTVCDDQWDYLDAGVVCRILGFHFGGLAERNAVFGQGTGPIWLDDVQCVGTETNLDQCKLNTFIGLGNCKHNEDAGVICFTEPGHNPNPGGGSPVDPLIPVMIPNCAPAIDIIRLHTPVGAAHRGLVEVRHNNTWGYVCDNSWDKVDAEVACRMLCYANQQLNAHPEFLLNYTVIPRSNPIILSEVSCTGSENSINNCQHDPYYQHNCGRNEIARLSCAPPEGPKGNPLPRVICTTDEILVEFDRSKDPNLNVQHLTFADPSFQRLPGCNFVKSATPRYINLRIPYNNCGTNVTGNATHITYFNTLMYGVTQPAIAGGIKQRSDSYNIKVACCLPRNQTVFRNVTNMELTQMVKNVSRFIVNMTIFTDSSYRIPVPAYPAVFQLGEWVHVDVDFKTNDTRLRLLVPNCVATPSTDRNDPTRCPLIEENCPVEKTVTTVSLSDKRAGFRYRSFRFVNYPLVYLHCEAFICIKTERPCDRTCNATITRGPFGRRRKRDIELNTIFYVDGPPMQINKVNQSQGIIERLGDNGRPTEVPMDQIPPEILSPTTRNPLDGPPMPDLPESVATVEVTPVKENGTLSDINVTRTVVETNKPVKTDIWIEFPSNQQKNVPIVKSDRGTFNQVSKKEEVLVIGLQGGVNNAPLPTPHPLTPLACLIEVSISILIQRLY
ncbi:deleted in malignant brain tumors 1 protein [Patella vulgata]|uniref:deleted in malignant brain tumors 1 protein n=1 Tax=Patella vulgata TaxID=6465 RepID=UPI0024A99C33|nr:deleted in malignant brain tumors 1 protein [Patella vulgata]